MAEMHTLIVDGNDYEIVDASSRERLDGHDSDIQGKADANTAGAAIKAASIPFGHVDSTSTSTKFTATIEGITELKNGVCCYLRNGVVTSASGFTININGLGAKPVYNSVANATRLTTHFNIGYTDLFIYNETRVEGGCWDLFYGYDSNSDTTAYRIRHNQGTYLTKTVLYRYMLLFSASETELIPANTTDNGYNKTNKALTTEAFDPFGPIFYYNTTTTVNAGKSPAIANMYRQYEAVDLRYSFNTGSTLTAQKDVFLVAVPQENGKAKLHTAPITQTLPQTEDGLIYIYLGHAYSTYQIQLTYHHPIYYYANGSLRIWTNEKTEALTTSEIDTIFYGLTQ